MQSKRNGWSQTIFAKDNQFPRFRRTFLRDSSFDPSKISLFLPCFLYNSIVLLPFFSKCLLIVEISFDPQIYPQNIPCYLVIYDHVLRLPRSLGRPSILFKSFRFQGAASKINFHQFPLLATISVHTRDKSMFCRSLKIQSFNNQTSKFTRQLGNALVPLRKYLKGSKVSNAYGSFCSF